MKLEKLLTLSQFVDNMKFNGIGTEPETIDFVFNYNNFLKQPLTKEMFVNPYEKPKEFDFIVGSSIDSMFDVALELRQEAEKKVIFEDFEVSTEDDALVFTFDKFELWALDRGNGTFFGEGDGFGEITHVTLHDIAEATKGELTLINIEL